MSAGVQEEILKFCQVNWWWLIFAVPAVIRGIWESFTRGIANIVSAPAKARAKALRHEVRIMQQPQLPVPGSCVHRNVVSVRDSNDDLVAWLCKSCGTQLPQDWAVRQEDL